MKILFCILLVMPLTLLGEEIKIDFEKKEHKRGSIIEIKEELIKKKPNINIKNWKIQKISILSKSKYNRGSLVLRSGYALFQTKIVPGNFWRYINSEGYYRINFHVPKNIYKNLQIETRGKLKIKSMSILAKKIKTPNK